MMIDVNIAKPLFLICFGLGFAAAAILGFTAVGAFVLHRLWTLRDDLQELLAAMEREDKKE